MAHSSIYREDDIHECYISILYDNAPHCGRVGGMSHDGGGYVS